MAVPVLTAAADHLIAMKRTLDEPVQTLAPWGALRRVLLLSARSSWLVDPNIGTVDRIERSLNARWSDIRESASLARTASQRQGRAAGDSQGIAIITPEEFHPASREEQVRETGRRLGLHTVRDPRKRDWIGHVPPSDTKLIRDTFDAEFEWKLLSAIEHGRSWALISLGYHRLPEQLSSTLGAIEQEMTIVGFQWLVMSGFEWFCRPTWNYFALFGWDLTEAARVLDSFADDLMLKPGQRFWRDERTLHGTTALNDLRTTGTYQPLT